MVITKTSLLIGLLIVLQLGVIVYFYTQDQKHQKAYWNLNEQIMTDVDVSEETDYLQSEAILEMLDMYEADMEIIEEAFYGVADVVDNNTERVVELERKQNIIVEYLQ